ncbi:hypothetical protein HMPREF9057_00281 [Actinomyces sp. oral taxon 171 str. F0337]|nr:hypothetical protein HMPREF9057_00281 [Actinomyces sp. oral taxon 171 str. F0337]
MALGGVWSERGGVCPDVTLLRGFRAATGLEGCRRCGGFDPET